MIICRFTCAILLGVLLWGESPGRCAAVSPERVLTIEEAVTLGISNNQDLLSAKEDVNIAQQRIKETQALFFPKLDLYAGYSRFDIRNAFPLSPGLGPAILQPTSETENFYQTRASVYQTLYNGGRSQNTYRLAKVFLEQADSQYEAKKNAVTYQTKKAFYDVLLERVRADQYAHRWQAISRWVAAPRAKRATPVEQLRLEEELALFPSEVTQAASALQRSTLHFLHTLGIEQHTGVELRGDFWSDLPPLDLQKCLAWAKQYRPELRQTQFQAQIDALGVSLSFSERFPTVAFGSSYEFSGQRFPLISPNWAATVYINLPLSVSDLYFGWSRTRERRAHYRQTRIQRAALEDAIELEVRQAFADCQFWHQEVGPREGAVRRMESLQQLLRQRFEHGVVPVADVVRGERLLLEARLRVVQSRYEQTVAIITLERAMGRSLPVE